MDNYFWISYLNFQTVVASSVNGLDLPSATDQAITDISSEIDKDSIFAWESSVQEDEVIVKIINTDGIQAKYGCHDHDKEMVCARLFRQTVIAIERTLRLRQTLSDCHQKHYQNLKNTSKAW